MLIGSLTTLKPSASLDRRSGAALGSIRRFGASCWSCSTSSRARRPPARRRSSIADVPLRRARALHADRDPGRVRRRRAASSQPPGSRASGGTRTVRPTCSRSRSTSPRLVLTDDAIPRLRDQPGADPLGEPVGDVARQRHRAALHQSGRAGNERRALRTPEYRRSSLLVPRPATYVSHQGERPIAITWRLHHRLSGDLFAEFAAAVA